MRIIYEIPDDTAPLVVQALCSYGGVVSFPLPAYSPTISDPDYQQEVADPNDKEKTIPNPEPPKSLPNPQTPAEYAQQAVIVFASFVLNAFLERQLETERVAALKTHESDENAKMQAQLEAAKKSINADIKIIVEGVVA